MHHEIRMMFLQAGLRQQPMPNLYNARTKLLCAVLSCCATMRCAMMCCAVLHNILMSCAVVHELCFPVLQRTVVHIQTCCAVACCAAPASLCCDLLCFGVQQRCVMTSKYAILYHAVLTLLCCAICVALCYAVLRFGVQRYIMHMNSMLC